MHYFFIDRSGWDFPKYLQILKEFDIYKAEDDYLNIKFEEPPEIGDCIDIFIKYLLDYSDSNMNNDPNPPVISDTHLMTERSQDNSWKKP